MSIKASMTEDEKKRALDATIAEYEDLRDEIKRRIDQRTHITELMITIDSTLAGVAVYTGNWLVLGVLPFVSAFCLLNIKASYVVHRRLTQYISEIIERQKLPLIFSESNRLWLSWETFYRERLAGPHRQRGTRRPMNDTFELALFIICCTAVILYSFVHFDQPVAIAISLVYTILGSIAVKVARMIDPYEVDSSVGHDWQSLGRP